MIIIEPRGSKVQFPATTKRFCLLSISLSILFFLIIIASASDENEIANGCPGGCVGISSSDFKEPAKDLEAYDPISSLEELLRAESTLLSGFESLLNSTPTTMKEKSRFLDSFEDLLRRQTILFDGFKEILNSQWTKMDCERQKKFLASFEDLLHREMALFSRFNDHLDINWGSLTQDERIKLLRSFEDLLRRQSELIQGFEDLNKLSYGGLSIEKFADKDCIFRGEAVTYKYVVKNRFNYTIKNITVSDDRLGLIKEGVTLGPAATKTFTKKTILFGGVCNAAEVHGEDPCGRLVSDKSNLVCVGVILVGENSDSIKAGNQVTDSMGSNRPSALNTMEIKKDQRSSWSNHFVLKNIENITTGDQLSRGSSSGTSSNTMKIVANQE
jgi:hypothetical protein